MASTCYRHRSNKHIAEKHQLFSRVTTRQILQPFKNWASELLIYTSLERHNIIDIMEDVKETTTIYDKMFIEHELDKQGPSIYEAEKRNNTEL
eukprot:2083511-Amphidinium_carterae.1